MSSPRAIAIVDGREKGQVPVSIGTSLAIEAAFGIYPDRPVLPPPIRQVKEVWFNLRTLVRNLYNCLNADDRLLVLADVIHQAIVEEMQVIESYILHHSAALSPTGCRVVYYLPDYTSLPQKFPKALLKHPKTALQIGYQTTENDVMRLLLKDLPPHDIRQFKFGITGKNPDAFIVTHLPVDLLARYQFTALTLLESHSGKIKPYSQWSTKLTNGKELTNIPFGAFSLQVFGDNGNQFGSYPHPLRKQILEIADQDRWSTVTTDDKIRFSLRKITHAYDRAQLLALL